MKTKRTPVFSSLQPALGVLLFLFILPSATPTAQAWEGNAVSAVSGQGDLYLYNLGAQQWLNAGGAWASQPYVGEVAMPLTISQSGTGYTIQGDIRNPYFADYLTVQSDGCWFDQALKDGSRWQFTPVTGVSNAYVLSATADGQTYVLRWDGTNRLLEWTTAVTPAAAAIATGSAAHWLIVSRADREAAMSEATLARPFDVTFYIKDQDFVMNGKQRDAWQWSSASANHFIGINGNNENAAADGQYYNGEIFQDANTLSQTLTGLRRGTYILTAKAFYRNGTIDAAVAARQQGTEQTNAWLFAGSSEVPLLSIFDDAGHYGDNVGYASALGLIPNTRTESGQYFRRGLYNRNNVAFHVAADGASVSIGIRKEAGAQDWVAFDDFRLLYCGDDDTADLLAGLYAAYDLWNPSDFVLDEDSTTFDNLTAHPHQRLLMRRTLDLNKWNSIILPVSIGYEQFVNTFGTDTRLARLVGLDNNDPERVVFQRLTPQAGQLALQAGTHYLIFPTLGPTIAADQTYRRLDGTTVVGPLYVVENVSMPAGQFIVDSLYATSDFTQGLYMMGTYYKRDGSTTQNAKIPAGSYAFARGDLYHIQTPQTLKAFRCWMEDMNQTATVKPYRISVVDEVPTGIGEVKSTTYKVQSTIYDLQGRRIGEMKSGKQNVKNEDDSSFGGTAEILPSSLPRGLYIVGGKKILIK